MKLKESCFVDKGIAVLFCSDSPEVAAYLSQCLTGTAVLVRHELAPESVCTWVRERRADLVLLDFQNEDSDPAGSRAAAVVNALQKNAPNIPLAAVCRYSQPRSAVAALRAGVREIADLEDLSGLLPLVSRLADVGKSLNLPENNRQKHSVLLMGARPGLGVSTLAVHLASLWQEKLVQEFAAHGKGKQAPTVGEDLPLESRVGLLDLGMPVGDCLLYLGLSSSFHFVDAVRSIPRLDSTLLRSAMAHDTEGVSVLAWPPDLQQMHEVSHADSLLLYERLKMHFGLLLTDLGGLSNPKFAASVAQSADTVLMVADQSVGALISLAESLKDLQDYGVSAAQVGLVLNRYDERYGMSAAQITQRFGTPLKGVLPDRPLALRACMNQGELLHKSSRRDPYVKALEQLISSIAVSPDTKPVAEKRQWKWWRR